MFSQTYTWALRRVFKFVLKRALGRARQTTLKLSFSTFANPSFLELNVTHMMF
jgi:hypothetical protein